MKKIVKYTKEYYANLENLQKVGIAKMLEDKGYHLPTTSQLHLGNDQVLMINKLLEYGLQIDLCTAHHGWEKNGKYYNVWIGINGKGFHYNIKDFYDVDVSHIHRIVVHFLKKQHDLGELGSLKLLNIPQQVKCGKCNGSGYLKHYSHVFGGTCFQCSGVGYKTKIKK